MTRTAGPAASSRAPAAAPAPPPPDINGNHFVIVHSYQVVRSQDSDGLILIYAAPVSYRGAVCVCQLLVPRIDYVLHSLVRRLQRLARGCAEGAELPQRCADLAAGPVLDAGIWRTCCAARGHVIAAAATSSSLSVASVPERLQLAFERAHAESMTVLLCAATAGMRQKTAWCACSAAAAVFSVRVAS